MSSTHKLAATMIALVAGPALAGSPAVETIRLDISSTPLAIYNFAQFEDYAIPGLDATIVETRIHFEFNTQTFFGDFNAANFGLAFIAPIDGPGPGDELLSYAFLGADHGWSGSGQFVFDGVIPLNGELITPGSPGDPVFYGLDYFHPFNITDPPPANPMQLGGQLFNSYFEIDYVLDVPAPATLALLPLGAIASRRRRC